MRIAKLILENFRGYYGKTEILFDNFTVFLGKNDHGKSTILEVIDIFINEGKGVVKIESEDLNTKAKKEGIQEFKIGICFKDIPDKITIDETNETTLDDEFLLNKEKYLEIWKTFRNAKLQDKETKIRCLHPANDEFLKNLLTKKVDELRDFVNRNKISVSDKRKSAELREAIRKYYREKNGDLKLEEIEIFANAEGLKDIWNKLKNYLPVYALFHSDRKNVEQDGEIQDPLKAKIEQIFKREHIQRKLDEIAKEIDKEIKTIAESTVKKLNELSHQQTNLKADIPEVATLRWKDVYRGIGFKTDDNVPLNKRGSGIRRLVLVSSFLAEVERKTSENNNHIIYAIEEPETSLHPDLQIKLINSLKGLSERENYQILITTHSPALVRLFETSSIRYVEQENGIVRVEPFDDNVANKVVENMGLLPNIGKIVICVEGTNDEKFLMNVNQHIPELKNIIDLKAKIKANLIAIIPLRGSNLIDWINRYALKNTNVIEFHLYDKDKENTYADEINRVNNRKDGSIGLVTAKRETENYVPKEIIEQEFGIEINLSSEENWDKIDVTRKVKERRNDLKEQDIKSIICGRCSKKLTKEHLESLSAWDEFKNWFNEIKKLSDRILPNLTNG